MSPWFLLSPQSYECCVLTEGCEDEGWLTEALLDELVLVLELLVLELVLVLLTVLLLELVLVVVELFAVITELTSCEPCCPISKPAKMVSTPAIAYIATFGNGLGFRVITGAT